MEKQKIKIKRKVMELEKETEVKTDIIVPDIKPDMVAIKTTNANTYICKEEVSMGKLRVDGRIDGYVTYLSESGESRSLEITLDYTQNLDDDKIKDNFTSRNTVTLKEIDAKILNERKICVTAKVKIEAGIFEKKEVQYIKAIDDEKYEIKEEKYKIKKIVGDNKAAASVKEFLETENQAPISEIIKVETSLDKIENKISFNKVLSKADLNLRITYQTEDLKEGTISGTFPITSFIDMENVKDTQICESSYRIKNMFFKVDSVVSSKITFEIDFNVDLDVYEEEETSIIQDMYSLEKDVNLKSSEIEICVDGETKKINIIEDVEEKECEKKNEYSMVVYFVKPCDTVWKIAKMFKVTMESIIRANGLEDPDKINVGEKLYILK